MTSNQLSPVTHYITNTSTDGKSIFQHPPEEPKTQPISPGAEMSYLYSSPPSFSLQNNTDLTYHLTAPSIQPLRSFPPAGASAIVTLDIAPNPNNEPGFMHRTQTLDYVVILEGEMELSLDGGEKRVVKRGEVVVQRGPMHAWKNVSGTSWARMLCVAIGGEGAVEGGMEFGG